MMDSTRSTNLSLFSILIDEATQAPDLRSYDGEAYYFTKWPQQPIKLHPFKPHSIIIALVLVPAEPLFVAPCGIYNQDIIDREVAVAKSDSCLLMVCKNGEIFAFSGLDWKNLDFKVNVMAECSKKHKLEFFHAVYDSKADFIYFSSLNSSKIFKSPRKKLSQGADRLVTLSALVDCRGSAEEAQNHVKGLHCVSDRRILFACHEVGRGVSIWLLPENHITEPQLVGILNFITNPWFLTTHFNESINKIDIAISSETEGVVVFSGSLFLFDSIVRGENTKLPISKAFSFWVNPAKAAFESHVPDMGFVRNPLELAYDQYGNLLVADSSNERIQVLCGQNHGDKLGAFLHAVWSSIPCTNTATRLLLVPEPKTYVGKPTPVCLVGKGSSGVEFYGKL